MRHCLDALYPRDTQSAYVHHLQRILAGGGDFNVDSMSSSIADRRKSR